MVFKITLCEHNLNFGKIKQYAIRQIKLQNWTGKRNFAQSTIKKTAKVWSSKAYPVGIWSYNFEKDTNLQRKNENYIWNSKMKKEASSGEKKSGPQPLNNSLASSRHQMGRNSTDPRPANACTNSCGILNSTQLYTEKLLYCFAGWHCLSLGVGVGGGGGLVWLRSGKLTLSFPTFFFIGCMKYCGNPLFHNIRFKMIAFIGIWAKWFYFVVLVVLMFSRDSHKYSI